MFQPKHLWQFYYSRYRPHKFKESLNWKAPVWWEIPCKDQELENRITKILDKNNIQINSALTWASTHISLILGLSFPIYTSFHKKIYDNKISEWDICQLMHTEEKDTWTISFRSSSLCNTSRAFVLISMKSGSNFS